MGNIKVVLIHPGAPEAMTRAATRVINGELLQASTLEGRRQEAKAIYNRMLGIKSTTHDYLVEETDEPAYVVPAIPVSEAGKYQQVQEDRVMQRMADMLAAGIAKGVAEALASRDAAPVEVQPDTEQPRKAARVAL